MNKTKKQLFWGSIISYLAILINIFAGLIYTPWMIRQIGQSDYGLYTLAYSLISLFLMDFGLSSATARYVSKYHAEGNEEKVNNFLGVIYKLYLVIDTVIFLALFVFYFLIEKVYVNLTPDEISHFKIVYLIAGGFSIINFPFVTLNGILTAYEKFIQLKLADVIYRILLTGVMIVALLFGYGLYALVIVHAAVGLVIVAYKWIVIKVKVPIKVSFRYWEQSLFKDIFGFSLWITIASLAQRLVFNITPSILGIVASSAAIAVFGVVVTIEGYAYTITTAINGMFMPRISVAYTGDHPEEQLQPLFLSVGKFQYAINGLIVAGFFILGDYFLKLWVGADYRDAYWGILLVTIPGLFFNSLQIANTAMIVTKRVKIQAFVNVAMGVINVSLSFAFSMLWGVIGACISIFVAYMVRAIALNIIYYKVMKFNIPKFIVQCYLRMSVPIVLTILAGYLMNRWIENRGWLFFGYKGVIVMSIYLLFVFLIGLNVQEKKNVFHRTIGRLLKRRRKDGSVQE